MSKKLFPFHSLNLLSPELQKEAIAILVQYFKKGRVKDRAKLAFTLLSELFHLFSFDLKQFCLTYHLTQKQRDKFLTYLLYGIYHYEIPFAEIAHRKDSKVIEFVFLTFLPECMEQIKMKRILSSLSIRQRLFLIQHC